MGDKLILYFNLIIQLIYLYLEAFRINVLCRIYLRKGGEGVPQKQYYEFEMLIYFF